MKEIDDNVKKMEKCPVFIEIISIIKMFILLKEIYRF